MGFDIMYDVTDVSMLWASEDWFLTTGFKNLTVRMSLIVAKTLPETP